MFLLGASDTYPVKSTGGSATHTQTENEVAPHKHEVISKFDNSAIKTITYQGDNSSYGVNKTADYSDYGVEAKKGHSSSTNGHPKPLLCCKYLA